MNKDIQTIVEEIVRIYCSFGFNEYKTAVREVKQLIALESMSQERIELSQTYDDKELKTLVNTADPIALGICKKLKTKYNSLIREMKHTPVGLPSLFNLPISGWGGRARTSLDEPESRFPDDEEE